MNVLIPLLIGGALLLIASRTYPFYLAKMLGVDDSRPTPAHRLKDGKDYVPSRTNVVFGHHFAVIAGAGPIVGPTLALAYGYFPGWFWILAGCILFGAVHDMVSMFISMREDGRTIADMSRRSLGRTGYFLFVTFLVLILTLINAIFLNLSCDALTAAYPISQLGITTSHLQTEVVNGVTKVHIGGIATTSVFFITLVAPFMGWLIHIRKWPTLPMYLIAAVLGIISIWLGFVAPVRMEVSTWKFVMSAYVFIACWVPVWLVLQPRDFVNVQILYGGLLAILAGLVVYGLKGGVVQAPAIDVETGMKLSGPIWPGLLITVACGAISGFHSLAATGTTVKQISSESDVRKVGYNAMILEGFLAILALTLVGSALSSTEYRNIVHPAPGSGTKSNPILAFSVAMGILLRDTFGIPVDVGCVLGILVLEGFVVTTLDTSLRLARYLLEELWGCIAPAQTWLRNSVLNTALAVGGMLFFAFNSTIYSAWRIFGSGNQLIGALALTVATVWLLQRRRPFWFAILPALIMTATTFAALGRSILTNWKAIRAAAQPSVENIALCAASTFLLLLAIGIVTVATRKFFQAWRESRLPPSAGLQSGEAPAQG